MKTDENSKLPTYRQKKIISILLRLRKTLDVVELLDRYKKPYVNENILRFVIFKLK